MKVTVSGLPESRCCGECGAFLAYTADGVTLPCDCHVRRLTPFERESLQDQKVTEYFERKTARRLAAEADRKVVWGWHKRKRRMA